MLRRLHDRIGRDRDREAERLAQDAPPEPAPPRLPSARPSQPAPVQSGFTEVFAPGRQQEAAPLPQLPKIFVSYSHKDDKWRERFEVAIKPLTRDGALGLWSDKELEAGQKWHEEIQSALAESAMAILLVSDNFVASDFIVQKELPPLVDGAERGRIRLLCIAISDALYGSLGIGEYQWLNDPKRPLSRLRQPDWRREFVEIGRKIEQLILNPRS